MHQPIQPIVINYDIVAVTGGNLGQTLSNDGRYKALLLPTRVINDVRFFSMDRRDGRVGRLVNNNWAMLDFIIKARNDKIRIMCDDGEVDPMQAAARDVPMPSTKRQRVDVIDAIEMPWITVTINDVEVKVIPSVLAKNRLFMELSVRNLELLLELPRTEAFPKIARDNVFWDHDRGNVWAWWHDGRARKWRRRLAHVPPHASKAELQHAIDIAADAVAEYVVEYHTRPTGSDDEDSGDEDDA